MKIMPALIHQQACALFEEYAPLAMLLRQADIPPDETIEDQYMKRWYLARILAEHQEGRARPPLRGHTRITTDYNLFLHKFEGSDKRVFHDHPWPNVSFILEGELLEHTPMGIESRRPGNMVYRQAEELHFLELVAGPAWTLFLTMPKVREWGFQLPDGRWVPYSEASAIGPDGVSRYGGEENAG